MKIRIEVIPDGKTLPISVRTYDSPDQIKEATEYIEHYLNCKILPPHVCNKMPEDSWHLSEDENCFWCGEKLEK